MWPAGAEKGARRPRDSFLPDCYREAGAGLEALRRMVVWGAVLSGTGEASAELSHTGLGSFTRSVWSRV